MDNKYYTPRIEEFHVGFECEWFDGLKWHKNIISDWNFTLEVDGSSHREYVFKENYHGKLEGSFRVKHLDRKDIEALGWEYNYNVIIEDTSDVAKSWIFYIDDTEDKSKYYQIYVYNGVYFILYIEEQNSVGSTESTVFKGVIKNKSELKRIMNQINITITH